MKNKLPLLILFFIQSFVFCEELEITLPTQDRTQKVYFSTCRGESHEITNLINYVLEEDFIVDGRGNLFEKNATSLSLEKQSSTQFFQNPIWKKNRIDYVIKPSYSNKALSIDLFDVRSGTIKSLTEIKLSTSKESNVVTLHNISDFLMKLIFKKEGIASKRIIYSRRPFQKDAKNSIINWHAEIHETDTLGLIDKQITFENSYCINPEFSKAKSDSDNYEFVYVTYKLGQPQIYMGKNDGTRSSSLVKLRGNQLLPKVSYDGNFLSFISDASGKSDVFIQKLGSNSKAIGKPIQIYSGINQTSASPTLSPDNRLLAFVSDKTGQAKIYLTDISQTLTNRKRPTLTRIKSPCSECTSPSFSPDGEKLVFSGRINGRRQIWLYDIRQKKAYQLTNGPEDKENPCFGSNSRHVVYNTTLPTTDLFLLDISRKTTRRLTKGSGDKHYPSFEK
jgi:TolB protein